jgi:hypothetical protein
MHLTCFRFDWVYHTIQEINTAMEQISLRRRRGWRDGDTLCRRCSGGGSECTSAVRIAGVVTEFVTATEVIGLLRPTTLSGQALYIGHTCSTVLLGLVNIRDNRS